MDVVTRCDIPTFLDLRSVHLGFFFTLVRIACCFNGNGDRPLFD